MTDPVAIAIVGGIVAVVQATMTYLSGRKTRQKVEGVHKLVDGKSSRQEAKIDAMAGELGRLNLDPSATTPPGPPSTVNPVTIVNGQVVTNRRQEER